MRLQAIFLNQKYICLTHGHIDHAGAALKLSKALNLPIIGPHFDDKFLLDTLERYKAICMEYRQRFLVLANGSRIRFHKLW